MRTLSIASLIPASDLSVPVEITGTVTAFAGDGRRLGWPTANIDADADLVDGVYLALADLAQYRDVPATVFVGIPTTMSQTVRRVEAWLVDVDDIDYYGHELRARLLHYVRPNQTFDSEQSLVDQLHNDEVYARNWFGLRSNVVA